jgi:hypothetical protein
MATVNHASTAASVSSVAPTQPVLVIRQHAPRKLRIGYSHSTMNSDERMQRESNLIATIRKKLPEFARMCADDTELVLLHQDAFAADYQEDEYTLLGMAIKYAGIRGKEVRVIGRNRSTIDEKERVQ